MIGDRLFPVVGADEALRSSYHSDALFASVVRTAHLAAVHGEDEDVVLSVVLHGLAEAGKTIERLLAAEVERAKVAPLGGVFFLGAES